VRQVCSPYTWRYVYSSYLGSSRRGFLHRHCLIGTLGRNCALFERCSPQLGDCTIFGREIPPGVHGPFFLSIQTKTNGHPPPLPTTNPKKPTTPTGILQFRISGFRETSLPPFNLINGRFQISWYPDIRKTVFLISGYQEKSHHDIRISGSIILVLVFET